MTTAQGPAPGPVAPAQDPRLALQAPGRYEAYGTPPPIPAYRGRRVLLIHRPLSSAHKLFGRRHHTHPGPRLSSLLEARPVPHLSQSVTASDDGHLQEPIGGRRPGVGRGPVPWVPCSGPGLVNPAVAGVSQGDVAARTLLGAWAPLWRTGGGS